MKIAALAAVFASILALAPVAAGVVSGPPPTGLTLGTVSRVIDGDTLVLRSGARVRLVQIDAPEAGGECHAAAATRELIHLAGPGRRIALEADPVLDQVDRYGRLLRYVHWNGTNVNVELVSRGAATPWFYDGDRGRFAGDLLAATSAARSAHRGMWRACRVTWDPELAVQTRHR